MSCVNMKIEIIFTHEMMSEEPGTEGTVGSRGSVESFINLASKHKLQ